ncbi:unnamed protein product [Cochlearia groenlandica]
MQSSKSSSKPSSKPSSSSLYLVPSKIINSRLETIFKKASELSILCEIEVCVIYYGPDGELKTWPPEKEKVRDMALRYIQLNQAQRRKKSIDLYGFRKNIKNKTTTTTTTTTNIQKKLKRTILKKKKIVMNDLKYPISEHYSPHQIPELIQSLESAKSTLLQRLNYVEAKNHKKEEKIGVQESDLKKQLMMKEMYGYGQNMCMSNINSNSFQGSCVSNTQEYSAVQGVQASYQKNQFMMKEMYDFDQKMSMSDINNSNRFQGSCVSNTQDYSPLPAVQGPVNEFFSDFQDMAGNTSFIQDFPDMSTSYDFHFGESSLLDTSTLTSLHNIPNNYFPTETPTCL